MPVIRIADSLLGLAEPLTSSLLAVALALLVPFLLLRTRRTAWRVGAPLAVTVAFFIAYRLASLEPAAARWLAALNTPLAAIFVVIIMPAMYLPSGRARRAFLVLPAIVLVLAVLSVFDAYRTVPSGQEGFYWFLIRPAWLMGGVVSLLVLLRSVLKLGHFRFAVRLACLLVLVYGGFAFRKDYQDYQAMLARRQGATPGIMNVSQTVPVLQHERRMTYLPSAPCRFTADGGYVQGCILEMGQRIAQVDYRAVVGRDPAATGALTLLGGALTMFLAMCLVGARWFCGWICPLSGLGGVLDWLRRRLAIPHLKPAARLKPALLGTGLGLALLMLAVAGAGAPYVGGIGKIGDLPVPEYPFCKICPSQQVCPVAAGGPAAYAGLPTADWGFGFFRYACIGLLAIFLVGFLAARRLWCRVCPMGMVLGVFNRGALFRLVKEPQKCNRCGVCADVCPMDIDAVRSEMQRKDVSTFDCVLCMRCVEKCPRDGCLAVEHGGVRLLESRFEARER